MMKKGFYFKSKKYFFLIIFISFLIFSSWAIFNLKSAPVTGYWNKLEKIYTCSDCDDCSDAITNSISGDIVQLNTSLSGIIGNCIEFNGKDNIIFDCQDNYIYGDGTGIDYGIYLNPGSDNNIIKNCNIFGFSKSFYVSYSNNNTFSNTTTNLNNGGMEIDLNLVVNEKSLAQLISIKNPGSSSTTILISQTGLDNMVIFENTSLILLPSETKTFKIAFVAPNKTGIFTGTVNVGSFKIFVSLNVIKTKHLLFDSNIVVLNKDFLIAKNSDLKTRISLIPIGEFQNSEVNLNYIIKDYNNKVYLTQNETFLVEKKISFKKNFGTEDLPLGKYIVGLELVYLDRMAPSSAHFEIVQRTATDFLRILMFILIIVIVLVFILITLLIIRRKRQQAQSEKLK